MRIATSTLRAVLLVIAAAACSGPAASATLPASDHSEPPGAEVVPDTSVSSSAAAISSPPASPTLPIGSPRAAGCEASALANLTDEGFVPAGGGFGNPPEVPLVAGRLQLDDLRGISIAGSAPLLPDNDAVGLPPPTVLWLASAENLTLIYAEDFRTSDETYSSLMGKSGVMVIEAPFAGRDAPLVLKEAFRNKWPVQIGPYAGALVWGDPILEGVRPFGLYWADDRREWLAKGDVDPDLLVDLARSTYC